MATRHSRTAFLMRRLVVAAGLLAAGGWTQSASAEDWMFRRSYYSHATATYDESGVPLGPPIPSRWAYRKPYAGNGPGFAARGGYRYNIQNMRSGNNVDVTVLRENWFEFAP